MMVATTLSGAFMFLVHAFSPWLPASEYGLFTALLGIVSLMMIPAVGLQNTLAQQTASAMNAEDEQRLAGTVQSLLRWAVFVWLIMASGVFLFSGRLLVALKVSNPAALWVTLLIALPQLLLPILMGYLQGKQNFLWLGWAAMINGLGRLISVGVIVVFFGGHAAGAVTGVLLGFTAGFAIAAWHAWDILKAQSRSFAWRQWLDQLVPLTLGLGATQFMLAIDLPIVRNAFDGDSTGPYGAAGMIGRGLVQFTAPLSAVMFPKLVRSAALSEPTRVLRLTLLATAALGAFGAACASAGAWLTPFILDRIATLDAGWAVALHKKLLPHHGRLLQVAGLIPWFVWSMLPLALANVLVANVLAKNDRVAVYGSALIALGYGATIFVFHPSFKAVIATLGGFSLLLLLFNGWRSRSKHA